MRFFRLLLIAALIAAFVAILPPAAAQDGDDACPAQVEAALTALRAQVADLASGQACFSADGSCADLATLTSVSTDGGDSWGAAALSIRPGPADADSAGILALLLGDAAADTLSGAGEPLSLLTRDRMPVRLRPEPDAPIIGRLTELETVAVYGRNDDGTWLRISAGPGGEPAWIANQRVEISGDVMALPVVAADAPLYAPFQSIALHSGRTDAPCDGASQSGLLLQSPDDLFPVEMAINGAAVEFTGTLFVQAGDTLTVNVLQGWAAIEAEGESQYAPAGTLVTVALEDNAASAAPGAVEPFDPAALLDLPLDVLPLAVSIPTPLSAEEIAAVQAELNAPAGDGLQDDTPAPYCRRAINDTVTMRAGPGYSYEGIQSLSRGTRVYPVLQQLDETGTPWWQLDNSYWVPASTVSEQGACSAVPTTIGPDTGSGYNYLVLDYCDFRFGPLRPGQRLDIEFTPPKWDSYGEAREAVNTDPGHILINNQPLDVWASWPRWNGRQGGYTRTFYGYWQAEPGTHRITGRWDFYTVICDVTVPFGP